MEFLLPNIPDDLVRDILSGLHVKSLLQFRCVSKRWRALIDDPKFNFSTQRRKVAVLQSSPIWLPVVHEKPFFLEYLSLQAIDDELNVDDLHPPRHWAHMPVYTRLLGSCNGLLLISHGCDIFLWNPSTRRFKKVLKHKDLGYDDEGGYDEKRDDPEYDVNAVAVLSGLCYNSLLDDYKVVIATDIESIYASPDSRPKVAGFSNCRREGWKQVRFPYNFRWLDDSCGAVVNGHLHWLLLPEDHPWLFTADGIRQVIVCFDQTSDKFEEIPLPSLGYEEHISGLVVMDGCLCLAIKEPHEGGDDGSFQRNLKVMAMKDYGAHNSWTPVFTLSTFRCGCLAYQPIICFTKDRNALMRNGERRIVAYNRKEDLQSDILIPAKPLRMKAAITYVESLNPPPNDAFVTMVGNIGQAVLPLRWGSYSISSSEDFPMNFLGNSGQFSK
ncbi:hypothetical protein RJ640_028864 [Escallonia rubra]|uniref:F-box domain-containing protein n=1 Tax=Escallonia rubra TaxID=112253 RepID=A0AA88RK09_9ASTE|nr:hypothetical protein RJ640_028864 [Escallonia rubra]